MNWNIDRRQNPYVDILNISKRRCHRVYPQSDVLTVNSPVGAYRRWFDIQQPMPAESWDSILSKFPDRLPLSYSDYSVLRAHRSVS